jgi:Domain of unknown function (DUF5063)
MKFQKKLDNFAEKAKAFCELAETEFTDGIEELCKLEKSLAELHLAILALPEPIAVWEEVNDLEKISKDEETVKKEWNAVLERFKKLPIDGYWEVFDASNIENESSVFGLVSDDLADIYSNVKHGLIFYEQQKFAEAFWEWKFHFNIHWGNHLVGATKAIRNYFSFRGEL